MPQIGTGETLIFYTAVAASVFIGANLWLFFAQVFVGIFMVPGLCNGKGYCMSITFFTPNQIWFLLASDFAVK